MLKQVTPQISFSQMEDDVTKYWKENEIFKKLFVRIDDCPDWSRESLYKIRKKQLDEEKQKLLEEKMVEDYYLVIDAK